MDKLVRLLRGAAYLPRSLALRRSIAGARRLLTGPHAWPAMEELEIPGFGTDLIRIDFPPPVGAGPAWGKESAVYGALREILTKNSAEQEELLEKCLNMAADCAAWPQESDSRSPDLPWRNNPFLSMLDMAALYGILRAEQPRSYIEIGSGISTRVASQARSRAARQMKIISIDPCPRVEVAGLCDEVFHKRLEEFALDELVSMSGPGTVLFFDGSHRCFPSSDVTVFFLEVLPRLQAGTLVHIHDIYLPEDYPANAAERFWSEQYMLAAYLLGGGRRIEVVLPCHDLCLRERTGAVIRERLGSHSVSGYSFWMRIVD